MEELSVSPKPTSPIALLPTPPSTLKRGKTKFRPWSGAIDAAAENVCDFAAVMSAEQEKQMTAMSMGGGNRQTADPLDNYFARRRSQALDINANNPNNPRVAAQW
jgi:hypothetical protein